MKKRTLFRIGVLALALCAITACLLGGTLAKYASSTTGTGTVNVAQWSNIQFEDGEKASATFTFNLKDTKDTNDNVKSDQIAPGDKGSFEISFGPAEVAYSYDITLVATNLTDALAPIKFYKDSARAQAFVDLDGVAVTAANAETVQSVTVYWEWETTTDVADTAAGIANSELNFTVTISAEQTVAA